jgi:DNA repair exonuclease SbcCD ATPase subunit
MSFDYEKFKNTIIKEYANILDKSVINEILDLGDENAYIRDTPISTGKRLILVDLTLQGKKSDGKEINFSHEFMQGVNIIIADNFKGKSSVFKAIQFALTGNDNLKHDIKKWLNIILLNFRINEQPYCVCINMESNILNGSLYAKNFCSAQEIKLSGISAIFEERGVVKFSKEIESFFFKQFSYYALKWTQKSSQKNLNELNEANASWKTYFKSIFLESKDTNLAYGAQETKIFQMLLGLHLTYPINRLKIKKDKKEFEKAKIADSNKFRSKSVDIDKSEFKTKISNLNIEIEKLRTSIENGNTFAKYSENQKTIISQITQVNKEWSKIQSEYHVAFTKLYSIESEYRKVEQELNKIHKNILHITKSVQDLQEFVDIGRLFSNLEIKYCPCCNKKVSRQTVNTSKSDIECILCHDIVDSEEENQSQLKYIEKIEKLKRDKQELLQFQQERALSLKDLKNQIQIQKAKIDRLESSLKNKTFLISDLQGELAQLETILSQQQNKILSHNQLLESLIAQKAVAEFQLNQPSVEIIPVDDDLLGKQIDMLGFAINFLEKERYSLGKKVLDDLSQLMLEELHLFGLTTITEIQISENFDISYKQDSDFVQFDKIAEGEQLRVKISLYLSLIQLDVKYKLGKHTRFLIIDSPSKEEGDAVYLEGLSTLLKSIESRFSDKLQILIGTAQRKLSGIVKNEKILGSGEYLF